MKYKILLLISILCLLTACSGGTIEYNGKVYNRNDLSEDTIVWLEKYNSLSEEEKKTAFYVPMELGGNQSTEEADTSKVYRMIGKVLELDEMKIVIASDSIFEGTIPKNIMDDLSLGDIVEVEYNLINSELENEISIKNISLIQKGEDNVSFYIESILDVWNKDIQMNENITEIILNLSNITNISNSEKEYISSVISEKLNVKVNSMFNLGSSINEEQLSEWFNQGLIIEINSLKILEKRVSFNICKSRAGFEDVNIEKSNSEEGIVETIVTNNVEDNLLDTVNIDGYENNLGNS